MGDDCFVFARLGVRDGSGGANIEAGHGAAFSLAQAAAEELRCDLIQCSVSVIQGSAQVVNECLFLSLNRLPPSRRDNRLRLDHVRRAAISRVRPATAAASFSSAAELAERCRLAAKLCLAAAIRSPVDPDWGRNLNKISPQLTVLHGDDDDEEDDDEDGLLGEDESEACLEKCDSALGGLEGVLKGARSQRVAVAVSFAVFQFREFAEVTVGLRFRRRSRSDCGWSVRGVTCVAAVASVLRRPRSRLEEGTAVMNLKNHCGNYGGAKFEFDAEEEEEDCCDGAFYLEESDIDDDDDESFVPVAESIFDLMREQAEEAEEDDDDETSSSSGSDASDVYSPNPL